MAGKIIADTIEASGSQISLNVGNVTVLTASSTGLTLTPTSNVNINVTNSTLAFGAGNVSFPSITASGDTNTGLYFPAADTIGFVEGGAEAMRINSSGNVGIGTASPSARVDVRTAALGTALQLSDDTNYGANFIGISGGLKLAMNGTQTFAIFQSTNERMRIDSSGNLQFNSGYGSVATAYGCRAWVNFNGQSTVAIRGSGNVTSITDNGTGDYTVNFTTAMPDINYCSLATGTGNEGNSIDGYANNRDTVTNKLVGSVRVQEVLQNGSPYDTPNMNVAIFR